MRILLHNQRVWDAWFFGSLLVALAGFIGFGLWFISIDTKKAVDMSVVRTVGEFKAELARVQEQQAKAEAERERLSRKIEAVKDATEPEGRP